jgi:hypothetical protein
MPLAEPTSPTARQLCDSLPGIPAKTVHQTESSERDFQESRCLATRGSIHIAKNAVPHCRAGTNVQSLRGVREVQRAVPFPPDIPEPRRIVVFHRFRICHQGIPPAQATEHLRRVDRQESCLPIPQPQFQFSLPASRGMLSEVLAIVMYC